MPRSVKATRPGGRSAAVRAAVHQAATDLLSEAGYDALQLPEVARRAGVNKTTVYRRWPTRDDLIRDLASDLAFDQNAITDTGDLHADLEALLGATIRSLQEPAARALVASLVAGPQSKEAQALREQFWDDRFTSAGILVQRAIERGELPATTEARAYLERFIAPIYFRIFILGRNVTPVDIAQWLATEPNI